MFTDTLLRLFVNDNIWYAWLAYGIPTFVAYNFLKSNDMWNQVDEDMMQLPGLHRAKNQYDAMNDVYQSGVSVARTGYAHVMFLFAFIGFCLSTVWYSIGRWISSAYMHWMDLSYTTFSSFPSIGKMGFGFALVLYIIGYLYLNGSRAKYKFDLFFLITFLVVLFGVHLDTSMPRSKAFDVVPLTRGV